MTERRTMPRKARKKSATGIYHVIFRGNNKQIIFEHKEDFEKLLEFITVFKDECKYEIYAYCLMDNHIHLLLKEGEYGLDREMSRIAGNYARWFNFKYHKCGHLFQDRFLSEPVEDARYFLTVLRYIHQNPFKAKMESEVGHYKWTSFDAYKKMNNELVDIYEALAYFQKPNDCVKYMKEANNDRCLENYPSGRIPDEDVINIICDICHCDSPTFLQSATLLVRNQWISELLDYGFPVRQLSRVTGISPVIISEIKRKKGHPSSKKGHLTVS